MRRAGGVLLGRPSAARLATMLDVARGEVVDYDHVGSTLEPDIGAARRAGRHVGRQELVVGRGDDDFDRAVEGLRQWACHRGIRARVVPDGAAVEEGGTVLVVLPAGPFSIVVPNRIVAVVDEDDRFGFAYGTLPGHQERGEECFLVERRPNGSVVGVIGVDARTATRAARLADPAVRRFQGVAISRYLRGLRDHVASSASFP